MIEQILEEIKKISRIKSTTIHFTVSLNCNPFTDVYNIKYWLDAPMLGITGYYETEEIKKYINVWKLSGNKIVK